MAEPAGIPTLRLTDADLSAVNRSADELSIGGQRRTKWFVGTELVSLFVASAAGVTTARVGGYDLLAVVSVVAFLLALTCTLVRGTRKPEEDWYHGRAVAESARTLAWKYVMGARPFGRDTGEDAAADQYLIRLGEVASQLPAAPPSPDVSAARELTPAMRAVRDAEQAVQREIYRRDRIGDQLGWYRRRAAAHATTATRWLALAVASSALGVVAAGVKFFGVIDMDLLGVFAALTSAAIAWNQLNQSRNQATAYRLTARELSIIHDRVSTVADERWTSFVEDAEEAISREHTLWLARHGLPDPRT